MPYDAPPATAIHTDVQHGDDDRRQAHEIERDPEVQQVCQHEVAQREQKIHHAKRLEVPLQPHASTRAVNEHTRASAQRTPAAYPVRAHVLARAARAPLLVLPRSGTCRATSIGTQRHIRVGGRRREHCCFARPAPHIHLVWRSDVRRFGLVKQHIAGVCVIHDGPVRDPCCRRVSCAGACAAMLGQKPVASLALLLSTMKDGDERGAKVRPRGPRVRGACVRLRVNALLLTVLRNRRKATLAAASWVSPCAR